MVLEPATDFNNSTQSDIITSSQRLISTGEY